MNPNEFQKNAEQAFATLCEVLDINGWKYEKDVENLTINCGAKGDDLPIPIRIEVEAGKQLVTLMSQLPFTTKEEYRDQMAIAVSVINAYTVDGCLDYNYDSGNIIFRITMSIFDSLLGKEAYVYLISCALSTVDDFNEKIMYVATNKVSIDEMEKLFGYGG